MTLCLWNGLSQVKVCAMKFTHKENIITSCIVAAVVPLFPSHSLSLFSLCLSLSLSPSPSFSPSICTHGLPLTQKHEYKVSAAMHHKFKYTLLNNGDAWVINPGAKKSIKVFLRQHMPELIITSLARKYDYYITLTYDMDVIILWLHNNNNIITRHKRNTKSNRVGKRP